MTSVLQLFIPDFFHIAYSCHHKDTVYALVCIAGGDDGGGGWW